MGAKVEALLESDPPLPQESWHQIKGWYWSAVNRAILTARVTLDRITAERVDLYSYLTSLGANIPISIEPFPVDYLVPIEGEIKWAVNCQRNHRSGGPSGMQAQHLKGWLVAVRKK